jgi:pyruvate/2-oxoglutarate dehydrogenase complex dihydrolipoamide dehydrogenase (E3) component
MANRPPPSPLKMFRRFGSAVTVIQHGKQLLSREDSDVAAEVRKVLKEDGIEILLETQAVSVHGAAGGIGLRLRGPTGERTIRGSHLLSAVGRVPNTERLNLTAAGVTVDAHGFIPVNDRLETNVAGIYALGDVKGGPAFTHNSYDDYRIVRNNLLRNQPSTTRDRLVPYTALEDGIFAHPALSEGLNTLFMKMEK